MTLLRLVTLLCFIFLKQDSLLPAVAAEAVMKCATVFNNDSCTCDEGGCDMSTCRNKCYCKGGGCKMPNCNNFCTCEGGNCDLAAYANYCDCGDKGGCGMAACATRCDCGGGGCSMPKCTAICTSSGVFNNVFLAFATIIPVGIMLW